MPQNLNYQLSTHISNKTLYTHNRLPLTINTENVWYRKITYWVGDFYWISNKYELLWKDIINWMNECKQIYEIGEMYYINKSNMFSFKFQTIDANTQTHTLTQYLFFSPICLSCSASSFAFLTNSCLDLNVADFMWFTMFWYWASAKRANDKKVSRAASSSAPKSVSKASAWVNFNEQNKELHA